MKVSLDGGVTFQEAPQGIRVIVPDLTAPDENESDVELCLNCTHEGVIADIWTADGVNVATSSTTYEEMMDRMFNIKVA